MDLAKQPKVIIPLAGAVIILILLAWSWYDAQSKVRWAREEALPEIQRLADQRDRAAAFRLAMEARPYLKDDPTFKRTFGYVSGRAWFTSEPSGAEVFWKRYGEPDESWALLGTTPIDSMLFPRHAVHTRIQRNGYDSVERLVYPSRNDVELEEAGTIPADVVRLPGGNPAVEIVGIDHIDPVEFQTVLLDKYEVTNAKFKAFSDAGGYENSEYWEELRVPFVAAMARFTDRSGRPGPSTWEAGTYPTGQGDYPVAGVSWFEAMAYSKFAGKSLPTVYHWSAAAWTAISYMIVPRSNMPGDGPAAVGTYEGMGRYGTYDLAGNVREWVVNPTQNGARYILGGGWNDPAYAYNDAYAQDPFDRSATNGFRTIEYLGDEPNLEALQAQIDRPFRDFSQEKPVSNAEFETILRTFEYDKTPLNAKIEAIDETEADWIREKVSFDAAYGDERVTAYLYLPQKASHPIRRSFTFPDQTQYTIASSVDPSGLAVTLSCWTDGRYCGRSTRVRTSGAMISTLTIPRRRFSTRTTSRCGPRICRCRSTISRRGTTSTPAIWRITESAGAVRWGRS